MASTMAGRPLVAVRLLPMNRMRVPSVRSGDATPAQAIETAAATTIAWGNRTSTATRLHRDPDGQGGGVTAGDAARQRGHLGAGAIREHVVARIVCGILPFRR